MNLCCTLFSGIYPNQLFRPYLNHMYEVPLKLIALSNEFGSNVFCRLAEKKVRTENCLSTFAVVGVVNTEIFMSFIKLPFYKHTG